MSDKENDKYYKDMPTNPHGKAMKGDMVYLGKSGAAEDIRARTIAESNLAVAWEIRQLGWELRQLHKLIQRGQ